MQEVIRQKAVELLERGVVGRVLGWKAGEFFYDLTPAVFRCREEIERDFVWSVFSGANLSKYLIAESRKEGKVAAFLKPCDSYSFVQLQKEHRIRRENVYAVGVQCDGMCDIDKVRAQAGDGLLSVSEDGENLTQETLYDTKTVSKKVVLLERCQVCKSKKIVTYDELIGEQGDV